MIRRYGLIIFILLLACFGPNCTSTGVRNKTSLGAVKTTFFSYARGRRTQKVVRNYLGLVSDRWDKQYGKRLNEIFEKIEFPSPEVITKAIKKVSPDQEYKLKELLTYIRKSGFYSLKPTSLGSFRLENLERPDCLINVITVETNGVPFTVARENLRTKKDIKIFHDVKMKLLNTFNLVEARDAKIRVEDYRDVIERQGRLKEKR